jgi:hypothetical protein
MENERTVKGELKDGFREEYLYSAAKSGGGRLKIIWFMQWIKKTICK